MALKVCWPDYQNSIANLPNSILKVFGTKTAGESLPLLDRYLTEDYKNYVLLLLDGMGVNILKKNLSANGFFRSHYVGAYNSVFPPTTVAATTSVLTGQMPCTHAWLGWDCYYPQIGENITVYRNTFQDTEIPAADFMIAERFTPYESVVDRLKKDGHAAYFATPFREPNPHTFEEILLRIEALCRKPERKYIYAYWTEPDHTMHGTGISGKESGELLQKLEEQVRELCEKLEDTLVIVTADHGHIDSRGTAVTEYPELMDDLVRMPSIEPRALNLFVKEGRKAAFAERFRQLFGDTFLLLTKEEVLEKQLFGTGAEHACFRQMLGDFLAVAVGDLSIYNSKEIAGRFIGVHAGLTEDELRIPLILCAQKRKAAGTWDLGGTGA